MHDRSPDLLKPTLLAGLLFGALGGTPFLNLINCACCALIIGCGFFGSYLYSNECRRRGASFRAGTGALVGLVAGVFYALVNTLVETAVTVTVGDLFVARFAEWFRNVPNVPPETIDQLDQFAAQAGAFSVVGLVLGFFLHLFLAAIFSTLGGLIGGAVFKIEAPPPAAPPDGAPPAYRPDPGSSSAGAGI
jgi:uncharacterized protein YqgC (DUF456 family)